MVCNSLLIIFLMLMKKLSRKNTSETKSAEKKEAFLAFKHYVFVF